MNSSAADWRKLTSLFHAVAIRRTKLSIGNDLGLPTREILFHPVELNDEESHLYYKLKQAYALGSGADGTPMTCFQIILRLRQVCNHGLDLLPPAVQEWLQSDGPSTTQIPQVCEWCDESIETRDNGDSRNRPVSSCAQHLVCDTCRASACRSVADTDTTGDPGCPLCLDLDNEKERTKSPSFTNNQLSTFTPSSKVKALLDNLNKSLHGPSNIHSKV